MDDVLFVIIFIALIVMFVYALIAAFKMSTRDMKESRERRHRPRTEWEKYLEWERQHKKWLGEHDVEQDE